MAINLDLFIQTIQTGCVLLKMQPEFVEKADDIERRLYAQHDALMEIMAAARAKGERKDGAIVIDDPRYWQIAEELDNLRK